MRSEHDWLKSLLRRFHAVIELPNETLSATVEFDSYGSASLVSCWKVDRSKPDRPNLMDEKGRATPEVL